MKYSPFLFAIVACAGSSLPGAEAPFASTVRFEQRIGEHLPLAVQFTDTAGQRHSLRDYFHTRPVVLYFGYARCPQLCSVVADSTVAALRQIRPAVGRDFDVISISLDPNETVSDATGRANDAMRRYGQPGKTDGWHFLTGADDAVRAVADACGFRYVYDPRSRQYAHPSGFVIVTPAGVVSRYFLGLDYAPTDVAQSLGRASRGETGRSVVDLLLLCFRGDSIGGRYGVIIWRVLGISVALTVVSLAGGIAWMLRDERRARPHPRVEEGHSP